MFDFFNILFYFTLLSVEDSFDLDDSSLPPKDFSPN